MSNNDKQASAPKNTRKNPAYRMIANTLLALIAAAALAGAYWAYGEFSSHRADAICKSHLVQLGAALSHYREEYGSYPPAWVNGSNGKPAHSWRVLLLPFLGHKDIYDAYRFDEPWNSPSNLRIAERMPDVYDCPAARSQRKASTSYVAVVGSQTVWPGDQGIKLQEITDGTSSTIQLIEIADSDIGWTEPSDIWMDEIIPADEDGVGTRFASGHMVGVHILTIDGAVRKLKRRLDANEFRKLVYTILTARGGEPYRGVWLPEERKRVSMGDFPPEQEAAQLRSTDVLPHLAAPVRPDRNYIYCATFQMAWDDFRTQVGASPLLDGQPSIAEGLNDSIFPHASLSPDSYVARMGSVREGIRDAILREMGTKFPGITPAIRDDLRPDDFIAYAFLQKNLPFGVRFDRLTEPMVFHAQTGDVAVNTFGFKSLNSEKSVQASLKSQVDVLHYASDDEFIIRLKPTTDEIVLAKLPPDTTLAATLHNVNRLIVAPPKGDERRAVEDEEKLFIPHLQFNILRRYSELTDKHLLNQGKEDWRIIEANQSVRFLLNERGARLESEAMISASELNGHSKPEPRKRRMFVFDRPFLLYLKENSAEQPYLVMWVANSEFMDRHK